MVSCGAMDPLQSREPCARKIDLSRKSFDATTAFRCLPRVQIFLPAKDARSDRSPQASGVKNEVSLLGCIPNASFRAERRLHLALGEWARLHGAAHRLLGELRRATGHS